ncbi:hypothetical protein SCOCK_200013 [Actinacidiphila cocklensis]|uniref:Uncharacterized protein n=1 Tax=Actinacidiphila cocklensis TaxID=887465 RepID=A0A9W4DNK8_9ACTN|nr:hypothetical protein SCOCK_200013 [Actinacidiphila cocklensis]
MLVRAVLHIPDPHPSPGRLTPDNPGASSHAPPTPPNPSPPRPGPSPPGRNGKAPVTDVTGAVPASSRR